MTWDLVRLIGNRGWRGEADAVGERRQQLGAGRPCFRLPRRVLPSTASPPQPMGWCLRKSPSDSAD